MSWSKGEIDGREVGYSVEATCDEPGCEVQIDRGVSYACGGDHGDYIPPGETVSSCANYHCAEHRYAHTDCELSTELCKPIADSTPTPQPVAVLS